METGPLRQVISKGFGVGVAVGVAVGGIGVGVAVGGTGLKVALGKGVGLAGAREMVRVKAGVGCTAGAQAERRRPPMDKAISIAEAFLQKFPVRILTPPSSSCTFSIGELPSPKAEAKAFISPNPLYPPPYHPTGPSKDSKQSN